MLKINILRFESENFLDDLNFLRYGGSWEDSLKSYIDWRGNGGMRFIVNDKSLLHDDLDYCNYANLLRLNNTFYNLLMDHCTSGEFYFEAGSGYQTQGLKIQLEKKIVIFSAVENFLHQDGRELKRFREKIFNEKCDAFQVLQEVERIVNLYKQICRQAIKIIAPNEEAKFLSMLFGNWLPLADVQKEHNLH